MLLAVPEVVLQVIAPVLEHIEALVFDLPSRPSAGRKLGHSRARNREIGDEAVAVGDLALGVQDLDHQPVDGQRLLVAAQRHPAEPAIADGGAFAPPLTCPPRSSRSMPVRYTWMV